MKKSFTILILMVIHGYVVAQTKVSIKVIDAKTSKEVPFVNVLNLNSKKGTSTDENGDFTITGESNDLIKISCVGYGTKTLLYSKLVKKTKLKLVPSSQNLAVVSVEGKRRKVVSINKIAIQNLDAPVTTNVVGAKILEERNVSSLGEAVKSATGVRPINRYGGFQTFRIRGFNNFVLLNDGVRDERHNLSSSAPSTNLANIERIEVLKGPASVLLGHSALGGVINLVHKKPSNIQTGEFKVSYGSYNTVNMQGGIGGPISDKLTYRADFGTTRTDGWRDFGIETNNGSVVFNYEISEKDDLEVSFQANNDLYDTDTGIPVAEDGSVVEGMDPETRYNDPQDYLKHKRKEIQLKYVHEFNDKLKLTNHFSWSDDNINYLSTEYLVLNETQDSITRAYPYYFNHVTKTIQNQLDLSYEFTTGAVKHKSVIGHSVSFLDRKTYGGSVVGEGAFTTIAVTNPILNQGYIEAVDSKVQVREEVVNGLYIQDWMNLSDKFKMLLGLRYDIFNGTYYKNLLNDDRVLIEEGEKTDIPSTALTYRAGLVYQPRKNTSLFASYSNYFKPSRVVSPDNEIFDPEEGYQFEVGAKFEDANKYSATLSAFYIQKNNIVEQNTVKEYHQIGEADSKGIELDIYYKIIEDLSFKGGYAYTDAKVRSFDSEELQSVKEGNKLKYAPEHMANAWLSYNKSTGFAKGLGLAAGFNYVGENYTNSSNTYKLPSYTTVDATIFYNFNAIRVGVNLNNIMDELYFTDAIYSSQFFPGMGRNVKVSLGYKF